MFSFFARQKHFACANCVIPYFGRPVNTDYLYFWAQVMLKMRKKQEETFGRLSKLASIKVVVFQGITEIAVTFPSFVQQDA